MKLELMVMAQSLERLGLEVELALARCRAALADILAESVASTLPLPEGEASIPAPPPILKERRPPPRQVYGPGELRTAILAIYRSVDECSLRDAFTRLQMDYPWTKMDSLQGCVFDLVRDGYLRHGEQRGVYRLSEPERPLSMVQP